MTALRKTTDAIIVHHHITEKDEGLTEIKRRHRARGLLDIGYHYVIRKNGSFEFGRPEEQIGAFDRALNRTAIGVVMVVAENFAITPVQLQQLDLLTRNIHTRHPHATFNEPEWLPKDN